MNRASMYHQGRVLLAAFCDENSLPPPPVVEADPSAWRVLACAYYREVPGIVINIGACASIGRGGRAWSYPGYIIDRTPYGVLQHELGHYVDLRIASIQYPGAPRGNYWAATSRKVKEASGEKPLTGYAAVDDAEWFAEAFRLFVTNPDLLLQIRPRTHREFRALGLKPVIAKDWRTVLETPAAPARTIAMAARRVEEARAAA